MHSMGRLKKMERSVCHWGKSVKQYAITWIHKCFKIKRYVL